MNDTLPPAHDYPQRTSNWPVVWGSIAIGFGVLGGITQFLKAFQAWGMSMMPDNFHAEITASAPTTSDPEHDKLVAEMMVQQAEMMEQMKELAPAMGIIAVVLLLIATLLFFGGILLCLRKRVAAVVLQIWAVLKIGVGTVGAWFGLKLSAGMFGSYGEILGSAMGSSGAATGIPDMGQMMSVFSTIIFVLSLVWLCALPVFFLIWFRRDAVREDMRGPGWTPQPSVN